MARKRRRSEGEQLGRMLPDQRALRRAEMRKLRVLLKQGRRDLPKVELLKDFKLTIELRTQATVKTKSKDENWAKSLGWFIPRKDRHVMGDILEDCAEMREAGCTERRIKFHVVYQWLIAVITLVPTALKTSIVDAVKQVIGSPK